MLRNKISDSKGFTLVELMVGMVILAAAIAGALSFFIFQSQRGHESFREKNTDEGVFSALAVMSRDIHAAGLGVVSEHPKLALLVQHSTATSPPPPDALPDELYLSYNEYMDIQLYERDQTLLYLRAASIWCEGQSCRDVAAGPGYQGFVTLTDPNNLRLTAIPQRSSTSLNTNVGAILVDVTSTSSDAEARDVNVKASSAVNWDAKTPTPGPIGTQDWTFPIVASGTPLAAIMVAAPAISYKIRYYYSDGTLYTGATQPSSYDPARGVIFGSLWRNRGQEGTVTNTGGPYGVPILGWSPQGGNPFINIRNFQVRRQYKDGYWDVAKTTGETTEVAPDAKNVRMLEITLTYQTNLAKDAVQAGSNKPKAVWSQEVTRVIRVSPRHLALLGS
jgi:prepilin-type N-terminal cleavage/methylation domain-containing protein